MCPRTRDMAYQPAKRRYLLLVPIHTTGEGSTPSAVWDQNITLG